MGLSFSLSATRESIDFRFLLAHKPGGDDASDDLLELLRRNEQAKDLRSSVGRLLGQPLLNIPIASSGMRTPGAVETPGPAMGHPDARNLRTFDIPGAYPQTPPETLFVRASCPESGTRTPICRSTALNELLSTWQERRNFRFNEDDKPVKIAILDSGVDLSQQEWRSPRVLRFEENQLIRDDREPRQLDRITDFHNFCSQTLAEDMTDIDGHGTQVAGIILRLAPRAKIYVARVVAGDRNRGLSTPSGQSGVNDCQGGVRPEEVVRAIDWAIGKGVDLINMSCGFPSMNLAVKAALGRARAAKIVVFAAMSNNGNNSSGAAWPANQPNVAIGIHSCKQAGMRTSSFTPPPVENSNNFMAVGEGIYAPWPESKGGGFRWAEGTSFATPVATAMAAIILSFIRQESCKKEREAADRLFGEDAVLELENMAKVLKAVSVPAADGRYSYVHPSLLWKDFDASLKGVEDTPQARQSHAWEVIRTALSK